MKLKKIIYSIVAVSMIAPVAIGSFSQGNTVQASTNKVTAHDIKSTNYYGKKAIGYYGFKHANGFWDMNRDLKRYVAMDHNFFPFWQAGNGAAYKVKGNYVYFNQSMLTTKEKSLIVKVSKVAKYSNSRGGKSMLKNIKTIGTAKELSKLTNE